MYSKPITCLTFILGILLLVNSAIAQPPTGRYVMSPRVSTDKSVTFSYHAPYTATAEFRNNFTGWNPDGDLINKQLKLFTISVGTDDFLYENVKQNIAMYREKGLELEDYIVDGDHTCMNCKKYLTKTLQQIFL